MKSSIPLITFLPFTSSVSNAQFKKGNIESFFWGDSVVYSATVSDSGRLQSVWVVGGMGVGFAKLGGRAGGFASGASLSYHTGGNLFSIRYIFAEKTSASSSRFGGPTPLESVWDLGVLYGICTKTASNFASLSAGLGLVGGVRRRKFLGNNLFSDEYEGLTFHTFGIPIEGQLFLTPSSFVGIGFIGFGNINKEKSFGGVLLCVRLGKQ
jgi:hypothetical protein